MMSSRSLRSMGSPPDNPSCSTPSARASESTRFQSSVDNSADARARSTGFEQYGQWSGQRYVRSANNVVGGLGINNQLPLDKGRDVLGDIGAHIRAVFLAEDGGDIGDGALAVAQ